MNRYNHQQEQRQRPPWAGPGYIDMRDQLPTRTPQDGTIAPIQPATVQPVPVTIDAGSRSFEGIQGKPQDATRALLIRFGVVLAVEAIALASIALGLWLTAKLTGEVASVGWLFAMQVAGFVTIILMDRSDKAHSPIGAERHRADVAGDVAIETTSIQAEAQKEVQIHAVDRYYDLLERHHERDHNERQRLLDERRRLEG